MRAAALFRSRLALRIAAFGLLQIVVVAAGFFGLLQASRPPPPRPPQLVAREALESVRRATSGGESLASAVDRVAEETGADIAVVDDDDHEIAASPGASALRCPSPDRAPPPPPPRPLGPPPLVPGAGPCAFVLSEIDGRPIAMHFLTRPPSPPASLAPYVIALVLLVVGVSSLLLARSILGPLRRLSEAAVAFGRGDRRARVGALGADEIAHVGAAFDDMAERVAALLTAEKELIANVSHELRTPLTRIRVALDLAREGDHAMAQEALADIGGDLDELERLLEDVLTAARLDLVDPKSDSSALPLRRARCSARELVSAAVERQRRLHPAREIRVDDGADASILVDPVLTRRLLENLLSNAHKYTDDEELPIDVSVTREGETVEIVVADRGVGIAEADLPNLFRPFFRAERSRNRKTGGLGLGLTLARRIAEAQGGSLHLESSPRAGTRAIARFPVEEAKLQP